MKSILVNVASFTVLFFTNQLFAKEMTILVHPFQNTGSQQYSWIAAGMTSSVISDLGKIKDIIVISELDRKKVVQEIQLSMTGLIDVEKAVKVGKVLGANIMFTGNYLVSENKIRVNANLINVEKGNIEKTVKIDGTVDKIFDLQDKIVFTLMAETEKIQIADINPVKVTEKDKEAIKNIKRPKLNAYELYSKGLQLLDSKKYKEAIVNFSKAIDLDPNYTTAYLNRGTTNAQLHNYHDEISDYNKVIELDRSSFAAYYNRGAAKAALRDYRGAIDDFGIAIELDLKFDIAYMVYYARGKAKGNLKHYKEAIIDYNKSIELEPKYAETYNLRGITKINIKDYKGAIIDFNKVIELAPNNVNAYFFRGTTKIHIGDKENGCLDLSKAGELGDREAYELIKKYCE